MSQELIRQLRSTRPDYDDECVWHKFLLDAQFGTGGFKGRIAATDISVLGWAGDAYSRFGNSVPGNPSTVDTYLDQFPRENSKKFLQRVNVASYRNYVGPICQLIVGYINERPMIRADESERTKAWRENCDGNGTSWDTMLNETIRPRAANPGWCPVLLDMPDTFAGREEVTRAELEAQPVMPVAIPLYPMNVLMFRTNQRGEVIAAKIRTDHESGDNLLGDPVHEEHIALWYRDRVERYVITKFQGQEAVSGPTVIKHSWGRVPLFIFRGEPTPGCKVRGRSIVSDMAVEARTHFNLSSEKRDHERSQVFAILGVPVQDVSTDIGEVLAGNGSALKVPMQSNMPLHFVAPPDSVAATLEKSIETSVKEMYRISRIEFEEPGGQATSGIARAYRFRQTNSRLRDLAGGWAREEQDVLRAVDVAMGEQAPTVTVTAASDYSIEDLETDIANALSALTMPIGPTAKAEIAKRTVRRVAPNLPRDVQTSIDEEIDEQAQQEEQDAAMEQEMRRAALDGKQSDEQPGQNDQQAA